MQVRDDLMYRVVWLSKTGKQDKVSKHALKNKGVMTYPIQLSPYYQILEEYRESMNHYGIYMYYLQNDVIDSAAKHALVIFLLKYSSIAI
jgi:hypothetical protein